LSLFRRRLFDEVPSDLAEELVAIWFDVVGKMIEHPKKDDGDSNRGQ
jgi:hypothetical protein